MQIEPVTQEQVDKLARALGRLQAGILELHNVDIAKGRGVLTGNDRCLWTKDGRRITVCIDHGVICTIGKEPDPECPK